MHKVLLRCMLLSIVCVSPAAEKSLVRSHSTSSLTNEYLLSNVNHFRQYVREQNTILVDQNEKLHNLGQVIPVQNQKLTELATKVSEQTNELRHLRERDNPCRAITQLILGSMAAHYGIQFLACCKNYLFS
jgi:hypothetical protein